MWRPKTFIGSTMISKSLNLLCGYVILFLTMFVIEPLPLRHITLDYLIFLAVEAASALGGFLILWFIFHRLVKIFDSKNKKT